MGVVVHDEMRRHQNPLDVLRVEHGECRLQNLEIESCEFVVALLRLGLQGDDVVCEPCSQSPGLNLDKFLCAASVALVANSLKVTFDSIEQILRLLNVFVQPLAKFLFGGCRPVALPSVDEVN